MKDSNLYFSHDSNSKDDPKCVLLVEQLGLEGYGIFWILIEILREQPNYRYPLSLIGAIARRYNSTTEKVKTVILNYGLFSIENDEFFFSESLRKRLEEYNKKRENAIIAGRIGGSKRAENQRNNNSGNLLNIQGSLEQPLSNPQAIKLNNIKGNNISNKDADFLTKIIEAFQESYRLVFQNDYVIMSTGKERAAASKILSAYKTKYPDANSDEALTGLREYFKSCCEIPDQWLQKNIGLPIIVSKFNEINNSLRHGKSNRSVSARTEEIDAIIDAVYDIKGMQ